MTIKEIIDAVGGKFTGDQTLLDQSVTDVVIDSRLITPGALFIPIKGARADGHDFIPQVLEAGALCALSEESPDKTGARFATDSSVPVIYVSSTAEALRDLATWYRFWVLKTAGNFNNAIGLPLTIFKIRPEHEVAVLEMGISEFGEMTVLAKMARPDIAMITTIGDCHLEQLGDRAGVYRAKSEMFDYLHDDKSCAILRADDEILGTVKKVNGQCPFFYGMKPDNALDAYVTDIHSRGLEGTDCVLHIGDEAVPVNVPIPGLHMLYHMMAGAVAGHLLGMTMEEISSGAGKAQSLAGHGKIIRTDRYIILDSAYNANPASMEATLTTLKDTDRRRVAILGDMGELGENELALHRQVGVYASGCDLDLLICVGPLSREIAQGYEGKGRTLYYEDKASLLTDLPGLIRDGDAILVKASHFMGFDEIVDRLAAQ